jgi:hypothetical protein
MAVMAEHFVRPHNNGWFNGRNSHFYGFSAPVGNLSLLGIFDILHDTTEERIPPQFSWNGMAFKWLPVS